MSSDYFIILNFAVFHNIHMYVLYHWILIHFTVIFVNLISANFGDESESEDEISYNGDKSKVYEPEPICSTNDDDDEEDELDKFMAGIEVYTTEYKIVLCTRIL